MFESVLDNYWAVSLNLGGGNTALTVQQLLDDIHITPETIDQYD